MNKPSIENLFSTGSYQEELYANALGWKKPELFVLYRAIVISVKLGTEVNAESSSILPQFSVNARIIGEDHSSESPENEVPRWYAPLMSNSIISVPEIGEQVFIMRETTLNNSKGYWIARVNDTDEVSLKLTNNQNRETNPEPMSRYGMRFDVEKVNFESRQPSARTERKTFQLPLSLGDVLIQGRNGSYIRNSFLPIYRNKPGILEMGILENRKYQRNPTGTVGSTKTKTVHFSDAKPTDITPLLAKVQQDNINPDVPSADETNVRRDFIVNMAEEIYNISSTRDSQSKMHRLVLGEKINNYFVNQDNLIRDFIDVTKDMLNTVQKLFDSYLDHSHAIPEINIDLPDKEVLDKQTINRGFRTVPQPPISVFVPASRVRIPGSGGVTITKTIDTPVGPKQVSETVGGSPDTTVTIPSKFIRIPSPPRQINLGYRTVVKRRRIKFDDISIGGDANPRFTVQIETDSETTDIQDEISTIRESLDISQERFLNLVNLLDEHLSKRHFIN